jgi:LysM repeat protein
VTGKEEGVLGANARTRARGATGIAATIGVAVLLAACASSQHGPGAVNAQPVVTSVGVTTTVARPSPPTTVSPWLHYKVQRGDNLASIAQHFRVSVAEIVAHNHLTNPNLLQIGTPLVIRRAEPLRLVVSPSIAPRGQRFSFTLHGAIPGEHITFQIDSPSGQFTGDAHEVGASGIVHATYSTASTDKAGIYGVTASGDEGTNVHSAFITG